LTSENFDEIVFSKSPLVAEMFEKCHNVMIIKFSTLELGNSNSVSFP